MSFSSFLSNRSQIPRHEKLNERSFFIFLFFHPLNQTHKVENKIFKKNREFQNTSIQPPLIYIYIYINTYTLIFKANPPCIRMVMAWYWHQLTLLNSPIEIHAHTIPSIINTGKKILKNKKISVIWRLGWGNLYEFYYCAYCVVST